MAEALTQLGRYRVVSELGRGAMGVVYKAEDPVINRTVAIKTILMSSDAVERAEYEARFFQEAKAAGGLNHPGIITIHDVGREGDVAYMAMEMLEGTDLRELLRRGRVELPRALDLAAQVAEALGFAHERGVVHRDIKPANVMVVRDRYAKIMDFGIARMHVSELKTKTGMMLGSPKYMSPEQVSGTAVDHRSDVFSLGVMLYELATGASPYPAKEVNDLMYQIATVVPPAPSAINPALPQMLDLIVARALAKDPAARYQSAGELAADLRACMAGLGKDAEATQPLARTQAQVDIALGEPTKTLKVARTVAQTVAVPGVEARLLVSRRFDSAAALERMAKDAGTGGTQAAPGGAHWWRDPDKRTVAIAAFVAALVAALIAFL